MRGLAQRKAWVLFPVSRSTPGMARSWRPCCSARACIRWRWATCPGGARRCARRPSIACSLPCAWRKAGGSGRGRTCRNGVPRNKASVHGLAVHKLGVAKRLEQRFEFRRQKLAMPFGQVSYDDCGMVPDEPAGRLPGRRRAVVRYVRSGRRRSSERARPESVLSGDVALSRLARLFFLEES